MEIPPDLLLRIASRHGELARLLATYRNLQARMVALTASGDQHVRISVHPAGHEQFSMPMRAGVIRAQVETELLSVARQITAAAATPFDWTPDLVAVATQSFPPPPSTTEGDDDHG